MIAASRLIAEQRSMVANGLGVAIAYTRPVGDQSYDGHRLAIRPISDRLPDQHILLAWTRNSQLSPAARAFCDFAKANFRASAHSEPRKGAKSLLSDRI
jgi:DNA-binding transcriptional LysR family regulator